MWNFSFSDFQGPSPYSGGPSSGLGQTPGDPFLGDDHPWRRRIFIVVAVVLLVNGVSFFFFRDYADTIENTIEDIASLSDPPVDTMNSSRIYGADPQAYTLQASSNPGFMTFTQSDLSFQIDYPADWEVMAQSVIVPAIFTSPFEEGDAFVQTAAITLEDVSYYGDMNLQFYSDAAYGQLVSVLPNYELIDSAEIDFGKYDGWYLKGGYPIDETLNGEILSAFTIVDGMVYVFTYTHAAAEPLPFNELIQPMLASFQVVE